MGWLSSEQLGSEHRYNSSENMNCWWFQGEDPQLCRFIAPFTIVVFHLNPNVKQVKSQFGHYKSANISYKSIYYSLIACLDSYGWGLTVLFIPGIVWISSISLHPRCHLANRLLLVHHTLLYIRESATHSGLNIV